MELKNCLGIKVAGAGVCWPEDLLGGQAQLDNAAVYQHLLGDDWQQELLAKGWDKQRPKQEFGVSARGWTNGTDVGSLELSIKAIENALELAGINATQVDCIFSVTCTPHQITSTVSGKIAKALGSRAMSIDIRAGGAGALDAMATAALYHNKGCRISVVVAGEVPSQYVGVHDLSNSLLFGDGAAAFVLVSDNTAKDSGLVAAVMGNSDWRGKAFTVPVRLPPQKEVQPADFIFQAPDATYRKCLADTWQKTADILNAQLADESLDLRAILPYAVTRNQVLTAVESFDADCGASLSLLENHGCIGCASPLAALVLHWLENYKQGTDQQGDLLGSMAVAGGISWAALLWRL